MSQLVVTSPAFENGGLIPVRHTGYGDDQSPELMLAGLDFRAGSLAIIMDDMGHPIPAYNHWVIWNLPVLEKIPAGIPHGRQVEALGGAVQGKGYGRHRYRGPKPPFRWSHEYQFHVYVLSDRLNLPVSGRKRDLLQAMEGRTLQHGMLSGHFR